MGVEIFIQWGEIEKFGKKQKHVECGGKELIVVWMFFEEVMLRGHQAFIMCPTFLPSIGQSSHSILPFSFPNITFTPRVESLNKLLLSYLNHHYIYLNL